MSDLDPPYYAADPQYNDTIDQLRKAEDRIKWMLFRLRSSTYNDPCDFTRAKKRSILGLSKGGATFAKNADKLFKRAFKNLGRR